jgi:predicted membrane-bound spermidine synthase
MQIRITESILAISFFVSGAAALIYQVCWNRALYGAIGVDMDSVTIIVSCFMLGIGIGGALGGWLADRMPSKKIWAYAVAELTLCLYGLLSLSIIAQVSQWTLQPGLLGSALTAVASFAALLIPTILMGMTLPLLSLAFQERNKNLGAAVGRLYFANTIGAAVGALWLPFYGFHFLELREACMLAAGLNASVAVTTLLLLAITLPNTKAAA